MRHAQTLQAFSAGGSVALGKRKSGSMGIDEWKSMLMYKPESRIGQLRIMRQEELQSGLGGYQWASRNAL